MTKEELKKIVVEKGGIFSGCGCCYDYDEARESQGEFIEVLWNKIKEKNGRKKKKR